MLPSAFHLQQLRMQLLHLAALRQLRERYEHTMEVGQIVEHRGLEEIRFAYIEMIVAHVQKQFDILAAQKLKSK